MSTMFKKRVLTCLLKWDYGDRARGASTDSMFFVPALQELVEDVSTFWYDEHFADEAQLQELLLERVRSERPDLVFFAPFLHHIHPETLATLSSLTETVAWFSDDQWRYDSYAASYAQHFTHVVTVDPWSVPKYRAQGIEPILSQWACQSDSPPLEPLDDDELVHDVSFVGIATPGRRWFVRWLSKHGVDVVCKGHGWPAGRVPWSEVEETFQRSRVSLNLSNSVSHDIRVLASRPKALAEYVVSKKRTEQVKARHFEIPYSGGFQLTFYVPGLEDHLEVGTEVAVYATPEDALRQITRYLGDPERRLSIARAGHFRTIEQHTFSVRMRDMLRHIWGATVVGSMGGTL